jgi:hypothetical protein
MSLPLTEARTVSGDCARADIPKSRRHSATASKTIPREDWTDIFQMISVVSISCVGRTAI